MEFLTNWLLGFLACTVVLVGIGAVIVVILPALFGLTVAIAEL